jgi:AcrR family transcriptional regulator
VTSDSLSTNPLPDVHEPGTTWSLPARQARSRDTRDRLLQAAEKVFDEKGYLGARMVDIAEAAGCSIGATYARFKDKDALFGGIVEMFCAEAMNRVATATSLARTVEPAVLLRRFITGTTAQFQAHRGMFRAIFERGFESQAAIAPLIALRGRMEDLLSDVLRSALPGDSRDPQFVARVVVQMVQGFVLGPIVNPTSPVSGDESRALAELETAVLKYLDLA